MKTNSFFCLALGSVALWANFSEGSSAQVSFTPNSLTAPQPLKVPQPPPARIYADNNVSAPLPAPSLPNSVPVAPPREYIFKSTAMPAPLPKTSPTQLPASTSSPRTLKARVSPAPLNFSPVQPAIAAPTAPPSNPTALYRVQIAGQDAKLLERVKKIEPLAFVRNADGTIQAGTFPQEFLAQQRLAALAQAGITGQIISGQENGVSLGTLAALRYQRP